MEVGFYLKYFSLLRFSSEIHHLKSISMWLKNKKCLGPSVKVSID